MEIPKQKCRQSLSQYPHPADVISPVAQKTCIQVPAAIL